jgi:hypothetical protein
MKGPIVKKRHSLDSERDNSNELQGFYVFCYNFLIRLWNYLFDSIKKPKAHKRRSESSSGQACIEENHLFKTEIHTEDESLEVQSLSSSFIELRNGKIVYKN